VARAVRAWALASPAEYGLLYGTPVPGYAAPQDTTAPAARPVVVLGAIAADARVDTAAPRRPLSPALGAEVRRLAASLGDANPIDDDVMVRGLIAWTLLFGALNFELFGRIDNLIDQRDEWFDRQMVAMLDFMGINYTLV